ncbi:unnamed protein product [Vicia faba]|uniref:Uncharacterized protein n=1 Tax=Vicia faba TaxID=3906 RepID=A0AAV0Z859_VICFA|nr:unnamed protein product [Vicia faba]
MGNENSISLNQFIDVRKNVTQTFNKIDRYLDEDRLKTSFVSYYGCLFVVEEKRKSGIENPYVVTLAHYYAICGKGYFGLKRYDAGLSMTVNIRVVNNDIGCVWMASHNHSSRVLLPMFQEVLRTVTWKWDTCPYIAAEAIRKQLNYMNKHLLNSNTETETEDKEGTYVQLTKEIGSNVLANQGAITGNNNGNMVVKNLYLKGRSPSWYPSLHSYGLAKNDDSYPLRHRYNYAPSTNWRNLPST